MLVNLNYLMECFDATFARKSIAGIVFVSYWIFSPLRSTASDLLFSMLLVQKFRFQTEPRGFCLLVAGTQQSIPSVSSSV